MHRTIKPHPHHLRNPACIVAVGLVDLRLQPLGSLSLAHVLRLLFGGDTMRRSTDRILTTHVGSLPRTRELIELNRQRTEAEGSDRRAYSTLPCRRCRERCSKAARNRDRYSERWRVRQAHEPGLRLWGLVELCF